MSADGSKMRLWHMPLIGGKVTGVGVASVYNEIIPLCKVPPKVYIEKVQAMKHDGKVGMASYMIGAGYLEMVHMLGWSVTLVPPVTWCKVMHASLPQAMKPKDKSRLYISQKYPHLYQKGSQLWPGRTQHPHEGLMDSFMLATYARIKEYGSSG